MERGIPLKVLPYKPSPLLRCGLLLFLLLEIFLTSQQQLLIHVKEHFPDVHCNIQNRLVPMQTSIPFESWIYDWHDNLVVLRDQTEQVFVVPQE